MQKYNPLAIEEKWQKIWAETGAYTAQDFADKPKKYIAGQFPYPSGAGLHAGHARVYTITDALARFYRQSGYNVLHPIGYDTFGLPAENYAIKTGISPQEATATNIKSFKNQFQRLGISIDWSRELNTSDPEYYKWTQWLFKKLYEKDLAYRAESYQWWCPEDQTVLANEQVESGKCWRCGANVEKKKMEQWFFRITAYAEELLNNLDELDWPENVKAAQRNWIGKSVGAEIDFEIADNENKIKVFTTRPDTIFGATFLVLAPEHEIVSKITTKEQQRAVDQYCTSAMKKSELERQENKDKTGVFTGAYAINPATKKNIPIWIADYVLAGYGEGAIMSVPAHDERDHEFAQKFELEIQQVVAPTAVDADNPSSDDNHCYTGEGEMINSGQFTGQSSPEARDGIINWLKQNNLGREKTQYKMRDWLISRQRYWGAPIPVAYDKSGNEHLVPDDQLPVVLPKIDDYEPDNSGRSALAKYPDWKINIDGQEMDLETDTLDGFACSSWYLLRYADPNNADEAWNKEKVNYWNPVDIYVGGDHATTHQLYVRFWTYVFRDLGLLSFDEPIKKFLYHGYILASDGTKMSKSKGNVLDPLEIVDNGYGADTLRTYILFMGPYRADVAWDTSSVGGVFRFLNRVWKLAQDFLAEPTNAKNDYFLHIQHKTIKKVTRDIKDGGFNTAIASLMEYLNALSKEPAKVSKENITALLQLLAPFAPHLSSELLEQFGETDQWPTYDDALTVDDTVKIGVQVNGKVRGDIEVSSSTTEDQALVLAKNQEKIQNHLADKTIIKTIYISGKILNIITSK